MLTPSSLLRAAFALALALVAVVAPGAATAEDEPSRRELRHQLADLIADEKRAYDLLGKEPPRVRTARLLLEPATNDLYAIGQAGLGQVSQLARKALSADGGAIFWMGNGGDPDRARYHVWQGVHFKQLALELLRAECADGEQRRASRVARCPGAARIPQCSDGRDNDRDGLVDARYDSGCSRRGDRTERSRLRCRIGFIPGSSISLKGRCSGPFGKLQVVAPAGTAFGGSRLTNVDGARICDDRRRRIVECLMRFLPLPRSHRVDARLPWAAQDFRGFRLRIFDFAGRVQTVTVTPRPFTLGPNPRDAVGSFTNGQGTCQAPSQFNANLQVTAPGDGLLTISQPGTPPVSGRIAPDGSFNVRNANENYSGAFDSARRQATGTYTLTCSGDRSSRWTFQLALR